MSITLQEQISLARGTRPAALVFKNARIFDAFQQTFFTADVAVEGETIVGVGQYAGKREIDLSGPLLPEARD